MARLNTRFQVPIRSALSANPVAEDSGRPAELGRSGGGRRGHTRRDDESSNSDDEEGLEVEQSAEVRRKIQRDIRNLIDKTNTEQTRFLDVHAPVLQTVLGESEVLLHRAKQTTEVAVDAALVIRISELAFKRTANFLSDRTTSAGLDLEEFAARCADYMAYGRGIPDAQSPALSHSQQRKRRREAAAARKRASSGGGGGGGGDGKPRDEEDAGSEEDDGTEDPHIAGSIAGFAGWNSSEAPLLDWAHLGEYACLPRVRRPGLARFLPPRVATVDDGDDEDAKAHVVRRRAAALRLNELEEVRPQVLEARDLNGSANGARGSDLTALAADVLLHLRDAVKRGQAVLQRALAQKADDAQMQTLLDRHGIRRDGGVNLVRFAVNPESFPQTVENLFYISFLVRDGRVGLAYDENGMPTLYPVTDEEASQASQAKEASQAEETSQTEEASQAQDESNTAEDTLKKQLVFAIDMPTWRHMIDTFHIDQPMIPHRQTTSVAAHPNGRAWFV